MPEKILHAAMICHPPKDHSTQIYMQYICGTKLLFVEGQGGKRQPGKKQNLNKVPYGNSLFFFLS